MRIAWKPRSADPSVASFRYRVQTPVRLLSERGHAVELFDRGRVDEYDMVVFSKSWSPEDQALARRLRRRERQVVLDVCDNHFYNPYGLEPYARARADQLDMAGLCTRLVCSTPALARVFRAEAGLAELPAVVGDVVETLDVERVREGAGERPRLLWFGLHGSPNAPSGMTDLLAIAPALERAFGRTEFELVVASNHRGKFDEHISPLPFPTRYVEWEEGAFREELARARAVVIPLSDNPFVACKTHNRLTLALNAGVPVIADSIESYREFASFVWLSDWDAGLAAVLAGDPAEVQARMRWSRAYLDGHWSEEAVARQWEAALGLPTSDRADRTGTGPSGQLSLSREGHLVGHVTSELWSRSAPDIELMLNGVAIASTPADLPSAAMGAVGDAGVRDGGGLIFPASQINAGGDSPFSRYSLRVLASSEPIRGAMLDVHRP